MPENIGTGRETRATLCLLLTSVIWGLGFVSQVDGLNYVQNFTFNGVRFLLGALLLAAVAALIERGSRWDRRTLRFGALGGLALFAGATCQQVGIGMTRSASKAGFITGLYVVIVPLLGTLFGKRPTVFTFSGAVLACAGLYFVSAPAGLSSVEPGDLVVLLGAVFWAVHILVVARFAGDCPPVKFSIVQFAVCAVLSLAVAVCLETASVSGLLAGWRPILYAGVISVGAGYTLQIVGQRHVEPTKAAILFSLETVFAAVGAALLLRETLPLKGYLGCGLIFAGIILSQFSRRKKPRT